MKIIALITAYNEDLFLDEVIHSTYDYFDEFVITDIAIQCMIDAGFPPSSTDRTLEIVEKWKKKGNRIHLIQPKIKPKNYTELSIPGLEAAKQIGGDWIIHLGADEVYPESCLKPMKNFLARCEKNNILGVNVHMNYFSPDFWHYKPFYNPRIAKLTSDACLPFSTGDVVAWPSANAWQSIELDKVPEHVRKVNIDYPSSLKVFHYSGVGEKRVKFKHDFYKIYGDNKGSEHLKHYLNKDWDYFKNVMGCKEFTGKHPEIMTKHPLYSERLY